MDTLDKWAERVYTETDFGRSVATFVSGVVGLAVYLGSDDVAIAAFSAIIVFPVSRLISASLYERFMRQKQHRIERLDAENTYNNLSEAKKDVVQAFVKVGGCVLTWGQTNTLPISSNAIDSLVQRELIWTSVTVDGMRETFNTAPALFTEGLSRKKSNEEP
jgi:hypothetical protein